VQGERTLFFGGLAPRAAEGVGQVNLREEISDVSRPPTTMMQASRVRIVAVQGPHTKMINGPPRQALRISGASSGACFRPVIIKAGSANGGVKPEVLQVESNRKPWEGWFYDPPKHMTPYQELRHLTR